MKAWLKGGLIGAIGITLSYIIYNTLTTFIRLEKSHPGIFPWTSSTIIRTIYEPIIPFLLFGFLLGLTLTLIIKKSKEDK